MAKITCEHEPNTHCIHSSERKTFRGCRQKWYWTFIEHLMPYSPIKPLEFGIAIHKGMEVFFNPETWKTVSTEEKLKKALVVFDEENDEQRRRFLKQKFAEDHLDDYEQRKQLGAGMLTYYAREIHPKWDTWIKPVLTEVPFHVELKNDDGTNVECNNSPSCGQSHPNPAPCTLDGRLDVLMEDTVNGGYYVFDWKTAGTLLSNDKHLYMDDQINTYSAALRYELGIDVKGFIYVELAKGYPQAPKPLKRKTAGKMYSVSKTQPTNYEFAQSTFKLFDKDAYEEGLYDEYLEFLQSKDAPKFHQRFVIRQNDEKAKNVLRNTAMEAMDMTRENLLIYPSPGKFNCPNCAFYEPCIEKLNGEDYNYTLESNYVGANA